MFFEFVVLASMALAPPIVSCLMVLQAKKEGRSLVGAIGAVAATWTLSGAIMPPLRGVVVGRTICLLDYWPSRHRLRDVAGHDARCSAVDRLFPSMDQRNRPHHRSWFTFLTRLMTGLVLVLFLLAVQVVFARAITELVSSGSIVYLILPDTDPPQSLEKLFQAGRRSVDAFLEAPGQIVSDARWLPGLAFSIMVQTVALTINLATALSETVNPGENQRADVDEQD
jgi:hypothetical protein